MTIRRLRPAYSGIELRQLYDHRYDHTRWEDHIQRVQATIDFIHAWTTPSQRRIVADMSCGDAAIARGVQDAKLLLLGDISASDEYPYQGRIEHTVPLLGYVSLFILSETLEHIDDPHDLLRKIHTRASYLLITTPLDEQDDGNPEHYWGWDEDGVRELLSDTGWTPINHALFTPQVPEVYYTYQVWLAAHASNLAAF